MKKKIVNEETNKERMKYAIHSHEIEGFKYTEKELEFFEKIAKGKCTAPKILDN